MAADLLRMLHALHAAGVAKVQLLAHSMGAMVLLHALPTLCASPLLRDGRLQLLSVTLLSPDHPLDDFLATTYPLLHARGVPLTIYGDPCELSP